MNSAVGSNLGGDIIGRAVPVAAVQVGADDVVAVTCEPLCHLLVELVPSRKVMNKHDPAALAVGHGACHVGVDRVPVATSKRRYLGVHSYLCVSVKRIPHGGPLPLGHDL